MKRQKRESSRRLKNQMRLISSSDEISEVEYVEKHQSSQEHSRFKTLNDSKKKYFKKLISGKFKRNMSSEQKMKNLIEIAESLVNFLLTRKTQQNVKNEKRNSKRKITTQNDENSEVNQQIEEQEEEMVYLSEQPSILRGGSLKDHQLVGLNWLISMNSIGFNGILADEMGLGKTIQTIALLAYLTQFKKIKGPHLIVCPNSVVSNWKREFAKWLPILEVVKLIPRKEFRDDIIKKQIIPGKYDVIITSFEGVTICKNILKKINWHYIIVDEAHRIKNDQSILSQNLRQFKTDLKLLITGTPLQNNLKELWSLLNFIMPEIFDDQTLFEDYTNREENLTQEEMEKKNLELITSLHKILSPFLLKRTKVVIDKSIPPKKEIHIFVGLTKLQTQIYKNLLLKRAPTVNSTKTSLQNVLMHLRKACNHPYLFDGVEGEQSQEFGDHLIESSGKMLVLDKILERLKYNHQVLIFSQFTSMLNIIEDYLIYKNFEYCRIDGSTFLDDREQQIQEFTKPNSSKYVFLLSTRAGGLGINLTTADTVILYDSDWNPQVDLQAMDRAHRIGQTKCVNVYRLITEHTVEEKIIERQRVKLKWDHLVILKGKVSQKKQQLGKNELQDLIQFGSNVIFKATDGTLKNEDLDMLLARGIKKTQAMNDKIDAFMDKKGDNLLDLGINSINIYEFEGDDYQEKRKKDKDIMIEMQHDYFTREKQHKRNGKFKQQKNQQVIVKNVILPYYHFYDDKKKLESLLSDEANGKALSEQNNNLKEKLQNTGFSDFSKNDFQAIIRGFEKYDAKDYESFAELIGKDPKRVKAYMKKMMKNVESLNENSRIQKNIEKMRKNEEQRIESETIIRKKCKSLKKFTDVHFDDTLYSKIKSRFYSKLQDKFLIYQAYIYGPRNFKRIKEEMLEEQIFMFDFHLKNTKESLLGKRIQSLIKMLKNEQELDKEEQHSDQENEDNNDDKVKNRRKRKTIQNNEKKQEGSSQSKEDRKIVNNQME